MTNPFIFSEIFLYIIPPVVIFLIHSKYREHLKFWDEYPLTMAIILIPLWIMLIHLFSQLIFSFSLIFFAIMFAGLAVAIHLFDYIRSIRRFEFKKYYRSAGFVIFASLSMFLIGLIFLRMYTYF